MKTSGSKSAPTSPVIEDQVQEFVAGTTVTDVLDTLAGAPEVKTRVTPVSTVVPDPPAVVAEASPSSGDQVDSFATSTRSSLDASAVQAIINKTAEDFELILAKKLEPLERKYLQLQEDMKAQNSEFQRRLSTIASQLDARADTARRAPARREPPTFVPLVAESDGEEDVEGGPDLGAMFAGPREDKSGTQVSDIVAVPSGASGSRLRTLPAAAAFRAADTSSMTAVEKARARLQEKRLRQEIENKRVKTERDVGQ